MTRLLLLVLAALSIAAQQQPPIPTTVGRDGLTPQQRAEREHVDPSETLTPAGDYCKHEGVTISPRETRAHSCSCKYSCSLADDGSVVEHEQIGCLAYCHTGGRACTCHPEEPCLGTRHDGNALVDMDGNVIAVARSRR